MRECKFIRAGNNIYVPPVKVWLEGWTRQRWLERYFKTPDRILVTSDMSWEFLEKDHDVMILTEEKNKFKESSELSDEAGRFGNLDP